MEIVGLTLLGGASSIASAGLPTSRISTAVPATAYLVVGALPLTLVPPLADSFLGQAPNRFLSLGVAHSACCGSDSRTEDRRSLLTKPLIDDLDHLVLDLGAAIVVVRMMECLENLVNSQHMSARRQPISSTLLMTSSGFELFDHALNQILTQGHSRGKRCVRKTDLDDKIDGVFDDNLRDLPCWLVQDDAKVILSGRQSRLRHTVNLGRTLERTLWVGSEALELLNTWNSLECGKAERGVGANLPLISGGDDGSGTLPNGRGDLREDRLSIAGEHEGHGNLPRRHTVTYGAIVVYTTWRWV